MPQYLSPGVYVEEVDAGPKPIEGVSTSVAGAVGVTVRGPDHGKPVLVTSFADYVRVFGGPIDVADTVKDEWSTNAEKGEFWTFHLAIRGFFDNGGQQIYVKRVWAKGAKASAASLGAGVMAFVTKNQLPADKTLKLDSLIGITSGQAIKVYIDGTAKPFNIDKYDSSSNTITLDNPLGDRVQAGRDFVEVMVKTVALPANQLVVQARSIGAWGDDLQVRVQPMDAGAFAIMADPGLGNNAPATTTVSATTTDNTITVASTTGFFANDWITINGVQYKVSGAPAGGKIPIALPALPAWQLGWTVTNGVNPGGTPATVIDATTAADKITVHDPTGFPAAPFVVLVNSEPFRVTNVAVDVFTVERVQTWQQGWTVNKVRLAANVSTATPSVFVWGASSLYKNGFIELEDVAGNKKYTGSITGIVNNKVSLQLDSVPGSAFPVLEGAKLRLIEARFDVLYSPADGPSVTEQIAHVRFASDDPKDTRLVQFAIESDSNLISVPTPTVVASLADFPLAVDNPAGTPPATLRWANLGNGDDNFGALDPDAFVGLDLGPGHRTGIQALEEIDDISITVAPSIWSSLVQNALIQQAELLKYRFAILDPRPVKPTDIDVIDEIRTFRAGFDTKYAALYFPRIEVRDPFIDETVGLGPSGHMAGLYARVDIERGVHKAPANEVIFGIDTANGFHGLEVEITKREQDLLNPIGINALRFFPNRGTRVWGARTLSSDGAWRYINVRRIFIFVERSIDVGTQWVVFEPNDEKTWARVRQSITNFLTTVWRSGALFGSKAEEAFFVRCDRTTMTQDDIDNGRLICVIGIAPVKPAEFVIFRIQQKLIDQKQP